MGGLNSDLAFLPKSSLSGHSGHTVPVRQSYTPLQQNYDRAVSPFGEYDHPGLRMPLDVPRMRSGNTPRPLSLTVSESSQDKMATEAEAHHSNDESDDDDDESDFSMHALTNMTVKSLQSLASYPNPVQKRAQKALLRGCRPRPGTLPSLIAASASASSAPSYISSNALHDAGTALRRAPLDSCSARVDGSWSSMKPMADPSLSSFGQVSSAGSDISRASHTHASGCGTPLPLSAGPPGQRQYRPSTFESTFKALKAYSPPETRSHEDHETLLITNQTLKQAGIEDFSITQEAFNSYFPEDVDSPHYQRTAMDSNSLNVGSTLLATSFPDDDTNRGYCHRYFNNTYQSMKLWDENEILTQSKGWRDPSPEVRALYGHDGRLTPAALAARHEKLDKYWYSGVNMVCTGTSDSLVDERGTGGMTWDERAKGILYSPPAMTVEEAKRIPVSEHANVLLKMAINSLTQTQNIRLQTAGCRSDVKRPSNTPPPIGTPPRNKRKECTAKGMESS